MKHKAFTGFDLLITAVVFAIIGIAIGFIVGTIVATPVTKSYNIYNTPGRGIKVDSVKKLYQDKEPLETNP